jgi:hypothetical protein
MQHHAAKRLFFDKNRLPSGSTTWLNSATLLR